MLKSSGAMAAATLFSRVLGLMREQAYMFFLGTTWVNDAFQYAFTIPNLFRRLLGEGALTAAFIPIFKQKEKTHGEMEMWKAANAVISGLLVSASVIVAVVLLGVSLALAFGTPPGPMPHALSSEAVHFWTPGQFPPKIVLMLQLLARDVSLHDPRLPDGGDDGDAQRARPFFHPGDGRDDAQRGDDRVRLLARAEIWHGPAEGTKAAGADFRAGLRRARGGRGAGGVSTADALARRLPLRLGFAVEK